MISLKFKEVPRSMRFIFPFYTPTLLFLFLMLSACETLDVRGHEVDLEELKKIKIGQTTKKQINKLLGTPSAVSTFDNNTWFYICDITSTRAFFTPTVLKSNLVRIEYDGNEIVKNVDTLTETEKVKIAHASRATPTAGHKFGIIEQIFGNVGRFNGKDPDVQRRGR